MNVGSLFSGIGGFDLGLERAGGFRTSWFCEQDEFCRHVLAQHWPGVPCYPDITELRGADVEPIDVLCGGFPCQDLSYAGAGAGLAGARSGLWSEYARLIGELRPRYVVVENVSALLARGLGVVLGDLATLGYDSEWDCLPAAAVGAPHQRDRIWLVAYPQGERGPGESSKPVAGGPLVGAVVGPGGRDQHGDASAGVRLMGSGERGGNGRGAQAESGSDADGGRLEVADTEGAGLEGTGLRGRPALDGGTLADPNRLAGSASVAGDRGRGEVLGPGALERALGCRGGVGDQWGVEPDVGRVADGVPARVDRLRSLGNALVPQIAEWIGQRIIEWEGGIAA